MDMVDDIIKFYDDPYGYVMYAFPWGEPGSPLEKHDGPDTWQKEFLLKLGEEVKLRDNDPDVTTAIRFATTSGHGVGKSALVAWLLLWFYSTRAHPQGITTANTQNQLLTKTWRELSYWHNLAINKDWFEWTATRFYFKEHPSTWFAAAIAWSEHRSEAFAGMHAENVIAIFDEASGIPNIIWEVIEGAMTTPGAMLFVFGNPTQNVGMFRECFRKFKHRWNTFKVDSRTAKMANLQQINQWKEDHGEDSDFFLVRVRGEFPEKSATQFIPSSIVDAAIAYEASNYFSMPVIIGVDVARENDDKSVILVRQGRKIHEIRKYLGLNGVQLTHKISDIKAQYPQSTIFMDAIAVGSSPLDHCRLLNIKVIPIMGSHGSDNPLLQNKRVEMWFNMREWLSQGADIPNDPDLVQDLIGIHQFYDRKTDKLKLEAKEDMKSRQGSPDVADALALTFAQAVMPPGLMAASKPMQAKMDWDVYS